MSLILTLNKPTDNSYGDTIIIPKFKKNTPNT